MEKQKNYFIKSRGKKVETKKGNQKSLKRKVQKNKDIKFSSALQMNELNQSQIIVP